MKSKPGVQEQCYVMAPERVARAPQLKCFLNLRLAVSAICAYKNQGCTSLTSLIYVLQLTVFQRITRQGENWCEIPYSNTVICLPPIRFLIKQNQRSCSRAYPTAENLSSFKFIKQLIFISTIASSKQRLATSGPHSLLHS